MTVHATSHRSEPDRLRFYLKMADILTLICVAATGALIVCYILIPKSGMETLALIIPWMFAFAVNVLLVLPALFCTVLSRRHIRNLWIYGYFAVFFFLHGAFFVSINQIDIQLAAAYNRLMYPQETSLNRDLKAMSIQARSGHAPDADRLALTKERIRGGVDVNRKIPGELWTPLRYACTIGDPELVRLLIEHGARIDSADTTAAKLLEESIRSGHPAVVAVLLDKGIDPNLRLHGRKTPLMLAAESKSSQNVQYLLAAGADPKATHSSGSALARAVRSGDIEIVRILLAAGADPAERVYAGKSLQYAAVEKGLTEIAALLGPAGASGQKQNRYPANGRGDLYRSLSRRDLDTFHQLLKLGVSPDERDRRGRTLLSSVCAGNDFSLVNLPALQVAQALIESGADVNASDRNGQTPLMLAAGSGAVDMAALLMSSGARVNATTGDGHTALIIAAGKGKKPMVALLLKAGADPNARTRSKMNVAYPLAAAVHSDDSALITMLLDAGAVIDQGGRDKGDLFQRSAGNPNIVRLLATSGIDINQPDSMNRYPLTQVLDYGSVESARVLLALGAEPDVQAHGGKHPLVLSAGRGHTELLMLFFEQSESIRANRRLHRRALHAAIENAQPAAVRSLVDHGVSGTLSEAEQIMKRSRAFRNAPEKKEQIRNIFRRSG